MNIASRKKILGFFVGIGLLMSATLAWAYRPYAVRVHDSRVNTAIENRFDRNNNGWIGPYERARMVRYHVNRPREFACDFNHNGWIDTRSERSCL